MCVLGCMIRTRGTRSLLRTAGWLRYGPIIISNGTRQISQGSESSGCRTIECGGLTLYFTTSKSKQQDILHIEWGINCEVFRIVICCNLCEICVWVEISLTMFVRIFIFWNMTSCHFQVWPHVRTKDWTWASIFRLEWWLSLAKIFATAFF
jgi:hypothetical protein